jgi:nanoRNase/pAp phosphatase (c-di-AMP/oligoRNAs hydrolase)
VDRAVAKAVDLVVGGFVVPVVNATEMISEIGNALSVGRPFSASYFDDNQVGMRRWSLRSQEDGEDVSKVAERFGGGGHPRAAGFQTPLPPLM